MPEIASQIAPIQQNNNEVDINNVSDKLFNVATTSNLANSILEQEMLKKTRNQIVENGVNGHTFNKSAYYIYLSFYL